VWSAVATCLQGAALAFMGQGEEGLERIRRGIDSYQGLNTAPVFLSLLIIMEAEVCGLAGKAAEGLAIINKALEDFGTDREDIFFIETYRVKGNLLLALSPDKPAEVEASYLRALGIAQAQGTKMLELRAANHLARLWKGTEKAGRGRQLLNQAYAKFSEGFSTSDLVEARELLRTE